MKHISPQWFHPLQWPRFPTVMWYQAGDYGFKQKNNVAPDDFLAMHFFVAAYVSIWKTADIPHKQQVESFG